MEWIIVLAAIAALVYWLSRTQGVGGAIARMIIGIIPRPKNGIDNRMLPRAFIGGVVLAIVAGGEIRPLYVALPVALIAYGGIRWTTPKRLRSDSSPAGPR